MLTDVECRKADAREQPYKKGDAHGLYLYVLPSGTKSWRWKYRFAGKEKRMVFGQYPEISLREAREARDQARRLLRDGTDPGIARIQRAAAQVTGSAQTFRVAALDWHASQKKIWSTGHSREVLNRLEDDVLPVLGPLPIKDVTAPLVLMVLQKIESRGSADVSRRAAQRISDIFIRAMAKGHAASNPAADLGKALGRVVKGHYPAVLTLKAAQAMLDKIEKQAIYPVTKLASRFLALTAVRPGVSRLAEVCEFEGLDGPEPIWRIPAVKMKLGQEERSDPTFEFVVPLSSHAVEVVKTAIDFSGSTGLIFRSIRFERRPISDNTLSKAYREAGFAGTHVPHGWRSTFSTVMNRIAAEQSRVGDREVIDLMLAHIDGSVEAIYNRYAYMPRRRELAQEWGDMLSAGLMPPAKLIEGPRHP